MRGVVTVFFASSCPGVPPSSRLALTLMLLWLLCFKESLQAMASCIGGIPSMILAMLVSGRRAMQETVASLSTQVARIDRNLVATNPEVA